MTRDQLTAAAIVAAYCAAAGLAGWLVSLLWRTPLGAHIDRVFDAILGGPE